MHNDGIFAGFTLGPMMWNPQESCDTSRFGTADLMFDDFGIRRWLSSIREVRMNILPKAKNENIFLVRTTYDPRKNKVS